MLDESVHHDLVFMFLIIFRQVDLTHLLASRDQELRALSAEVITLGQPDIAHYAYGRGGINT